MGLFDKDEKKPTIGTAVTHQLNKVNPPLQGSVVQKGPLGRSASDFDVGMGNAQAVDFLGRPIKK